MTKPDDDQDDEMEREPEPEREPDPRDEDGGDPNGAFHADLEGARFHFRYRPERLQVSSLEYVSTCSFRFGGREYRNLHVVDVSTTGLGLLSKEPLAIEQDSEVEDLRFEHRGRLVWQGRARVIYPQDGKRLRFGLRFIGRPLDIAELRFRDDFVEQRLGHALERLEDYEAKLPADWRAKVMHLQQLLLEAKQILDAQEEADRTGSWKLPSRSWRLVEALYERWEPEFRRVTEALDMQTAGFDDDQVELGLLYAQGIIMQEFSKCEMLWRAYNKPQGYAGDFRMMELAQTDVLEGDTLYQRFLHYISQHNSLGRTIKARAEVAYRAAAETLALDRPVRILSLAAGPAVELRRLIRETPEFKHPVDILLVDQDEDALRCCLQELNRVRGEREDDPPIEFHCLHFSLRQILKPKTPGERQLVEQVLHGVDLVYSMGLFDYLLQPLAKHTVARLYSLLNPGGRLFIGNLARVPDSTWIMEFATAWHLIYRTEPDMVGLTDAIRGPRPEVAVHKDATGHCLFLDARQV
jgi:extracellular factor (EF) 3-hydroxypalmitic acid methyl ester biosynthesis protein